MTENITFIKGHYSPAEAADVLLSLINDKIKFHNVKLLNLREEEPDRMPGSDERLKGLREAKKIIEQLVLQAHEHGQELEINSNIEIRLIDKTNP